MRHIDKDTITPERFWANQNVEHANRLRALLLDRPAAAEGNET